MVRILAFVLIIGGLGQAKGWNMTKKNHATVEKEKTTGQTVKQNVRFTVGNTSVPLLLEIWGSPMLKAMQKAHSVDQLVQAWTQRGGDTSKLAPLLQKRESVDREHNPAKLDKVLDEILAVVRPGGEPLPAISAFDAHGDELRHFLDQTDQYAQDAFRIQGIEDYLGWGVVEQEEGKWNWDVYKENARTIKQRGYLYIVYSWIQNLPRWVRGNPDYPMAGLVETGLDTEALTIFAPQTWDIYDQFYGEMKKALGDAIDLIRYSSPYDYGEVAYPAQASEWAFPMKNLKSGFWVNDKYARAHFKEAMKKRYDTIENVNRAWNTAYASFDKIDYPPDATSPRYWLDFVNWYHDGNTEMTGVLLDRIRKHFPNTPIAFNLGWPFEKVNIGQDLTGFIKMAASKGIIVRGPTGPIVPFLYTKRVATAVRHYSLPEFSSEPVDGSAKREDIASALFKDLTTGVNWHFDYMGNYDRGKDLFLQACELPMWPYPEIDLALFFSTAAHRIENWNSWRGEMFSGGYPEGMLEFAEQLRDIVDYDVVDERLIGDKALARYTCLVWSHGKYIEPDTLSAILEWVRQGGFLVVHDLRTVSVIDADQGLLDSVRGLAEKEGLRSPGKGYVYDAKGKMDTITRLIVNRGDLTKVSGSLPPTLTRVPVLDTVADGILVSAFNDGILLFNQTDKTVVKDIPDIPAGSWSLVYEHLPRQIELAPLALRWIDGKTGQIAP
jgi:hypothetical protein